MAQLQDESLPFKPRARALLLLGDQLIRDAGIAVFELVKNAYDADSASAAVTMEHVDDRTRGRIIVEDAGVGMDYATVRNVYLEPGTDFRIRQRLANERTPKYGRLPLGEKGVGRFAAHKLGRHVKLITKRAGSREVLVEIDWERFLAEKYLSDVHVRVRERSRRFSEGGRTGTRIEVTGLREPWTRGMVRELARAINSICSPFEREGEFTATLSIPDHRDWLTGLLTVEQVRDFALFRSHCDLESGNLSYTYRFVPFPAMRERVKPRTVTRSDINIVDADRRRIDLVAAHIGPITIDLYIFDRDPRMLALGEVPDKKGLKEFLDESGGIRVYRDGIRVYDYGEPGNDWLSLGTRRVNVPAQRISNNLIVGAIDLELSESIDPEKGLGLIEKTNREGFVDNPAFRFFREAVTFAITQIEAERNQDKTHLRNVFSGRKLKEPVLQDLSDLRERLSHNKALAEEVGPYLDRIEADFTLIRDRFLLSASAGLSLSVVIHEVEKGVAELIKAVENDHASPRVKRLAKHVASLVEGYGALLRGSGTARHKASVLAEQAIFNTELRLRAHEITLTKALEASDFDVRCSRRLVVSTLMNLIDNSIWWLDNKWGRRGSAKRIYVGTSDELKEGRAIVVADNGPGFMDPPEYLVEPFISRKPDGIGLGLHIADQAMKVQGGRLLFLDKGDVRLPRGFDGALVALAFPRREK